MKKNLKDQTNYTTSATVVEIRNELQTSLQHAKRIWQSIEMMELVWNEDNKLSVIKVIHTLLAERCGLSPDDFTKACNSWGR